MTRKLVSKKELKSVYGIPYCPAHIARLEGAGSFPQKDDAWRLQGRV
jgi:prophage regulatory protein